MGNSQSGKTYCSRRPTVSVKVGEGNSGSILVICPPCISPSSISLEIGRDNSGSVSVIRSPCRSPPFPSNYVNQLVSSEMDIFQCGKAHHSYGSSVFVEIGRNNSGSILVICPPCSSPSSVSLEVGRDNSGPILVICSQCSSSSVSKNDLNQIVSSQMDNSQSDRTHISSTYDRPSLFVVIGRNNSGSISVTYLPCSKPSAATIHNMNQLVSSKMENSQCGKTHCCRLGDPCR